MLKKPDAGEFQTPFSMAHSWTLFIFTVGRSRHSSALKATLSGFVDVWLQDVLLRFRSHPTRFKSGYTPCRVSAAESSDAQGIF